MASEVLLEIGTEEIPARMAPAAAAQLGELFAAELKALQVASGEVRTYCTPRRLTLLVRGATTRQADRVEEKVGPAVKVAFDADGAPTKAGAGFARGQGVDPSALETVETPKGTYVCVHRTIEGQPLATLLREVFPRVVGKLHFPKSMRWGSQRTAFVRPVHWLLALCDGEVVPFSYAGVTSGAETRGHRFLAPDTFAVTGIDDYEQRLAAAHVVLDPEERRASIAADLERLGAEAGGRVVDDPGLLEEVVHLIEEPISTLGRFDEAYLAIPREVLVSAMRGHQRYFAIEDDGGDLLPAFAVTNNTRAKDMALVTRGNERVLRARLDDARFFFEDDRRRTLPDFLPKLEQRVFLKPLGTMRAKADRVAQLAGRLADQLAPAERATAARAGLLAKADLCTSVVAEFPDLQGVMGREYARLSGEPAAVAAAIYEHYLPRSADDALPQTGAGAVVALADKADSIAGCFGVGLVPTYAQDPYALRRQALGVIRILMDRGWTVALGDVLRPAIEGYGDLLQKPADELLTEILGFFQGRLRHLLASDHPVDVVDAVLAVDAEHVVDVAAKVGALAALRARADFEPLAVAFKRVVNIIKDQSPEELRADALVEESERGLYEAHEARRAEVAEFVGARDFDGALRAVTDLKPAVDRFFDDVMVMADDAGVRANRVALLQHIAATFRQIADFARIQVAAAPGKKAG